MIIYQSIFEICIYIISMITIVFQQNYIICNIVGARDGEWHR